MFKNNIAEEHQKDKDFEVLETHPAHSSSRRSCETCPEHVSAQNPASSACVPAPASVPWAVPRSGAVTEEPEFVFLAPEHCPFRSSYLIRILFSSPEFRKGPNTFVHTEV